MKFNFNSYIPQEKEVSFMNLKDLRIKSNLSQAELAERAGISQGYLSSLERGEKQPTLPVLKRLASALGISVSALIDDNKPRKAG